MFGKDGIDATLTSKTTATVIVPVFSWQEKQHKLNCCIRGMHFIAKTIVAGITLRLDACTEKTPVLNSTFA